MEDADSVKGILSKWYCRYFCQRKSGDAERNTAIEIEKIKMGCESSKVYSSISSCVNKPGEVQKQNSVNSHSSSDGDDEIAENARQVDEIGRRAASNADLINVQREEKTDVNALLEDRWLRHHFSDQNVLNANQKFEKYKSEGNIDFSKDGFRDLNDNFINTSKNSHLPNKTNFNYGKTPQDSQLDRNQVAFKLSILHFNDVYELTERKKEPVGGAARFTSLLRETAERIYQNDKSKPFLAFSGDCLNPSTLSSATKGEHMIEVLNELKVDAAVFGNHEFDFGVTHAARCIKRMDFPWLLSNVIDRCAAQPLGDGVVSKIVPWKCSGKIIKIGLVGLIEEEWLDTLATVDKSDLDFQDFVERGKELSAKLKADGADLVIALTHMRWPNDIKLAQEVWDIDIILGGHDHDYGVKEINDCVIVKSGSDFRMFSSIDIYKSSLDGSLTIAVERHDVTKLTTEDTGMKKIVDKYMNVLDQQLDKPIGVTKANLDGLYKSVRYKETNLGNFIADIMKMATKSDIVLINSGTFRSNAIHPAGEFKVRDLMTILPIHDTIVLLEVTGRQLVDALENSVSKFPNFEGRFPQISGFTFAFDQNAPPLSRVVVSSILIQGELLQLGKIYRLATKAYVARGKDGYQCLKKCPLLSDPDCGPLLSTVVRNHVVGVKRMMDYERSKECKIIVSLDGTEIDVKGKNCSVSELITLINKEEEAPVDLLRESMEKLMKTTELSPTKRVSRPHLMQHLVEINTTKYHVKNPDIVSKWEECIKKIGSESVLHERRKSPHDIKWQVTPLLEGRIFYCPKTFDV